MKRLILTIDQGTTSSKAALVSEGLHILNLKSLFQENIYQKPGWSETNPNLLYKNVKALCDKLILDYDNDKKYSIEGIGITNQRESCLIWNRKTGEPYGNAILWNDTRTNDIVDGLLHFSNGNQDEFKKITGLPISTYFSGFKYKYMIENIPEVNQKITNNDYDDLCFGTIDTWLIYKLTKGKSFVTDVTNASRTMLMDLNTLEWDKHMLDVFGIPLKCLPEIKASSDYFGESHDLNIQLPIKGVIGDQQSACIGHCLQVHEVKNTYGTGGFLLMNTGEEKIFSKHGLLTTVLYKDRNNKPLYALEGSIESAGNTLTWLKNNLNIFDDYDHLKRLFLSEKDSGGVYFVPSFNGLYSPYWNTNSRACIFGMTMNTSKGHLVKAAFEGVSFRTHDIIRCFEEDTDVKIHVLKVDGGMTLSNEFLQTQANLANCQVSTKKEQHITLLGSSLTAMVGCNIYSDYKNAHHFLQQSNSFSPELGEEELNFKYKKWKKAVERSMNWV